MSSTASNVTVTQGDKQPLLTMTLYTDESLSTELDLTDAQTVDWHIAADGVAVVKASTIDADQQNSKGQTHWQWDGDALLVPNTYTVRPVITWNDATTETGHGWMTITVNPAA